MPLHYYDIIATDKNASHRPGAEESGDVLPMAPGQTAILGDITMYSEQSRERKEP